jgi:hypothetical protein
MLEHVLEREHARLSVDDREEDDSERRLERRVFVELVEDDLRDLALLEVEHDAHAVAVALVADGRDALEALLVDELSHVLDEPGLVDLIGNLADDDRLAIGPRVLLDLGAAAHVQDSAARGERLLDAAAAVDDAARGKSGPGMWRTSAAVSAAGSSRRCTAASQTSPRLCGGIFVAMPTAMPSAPFTRRFGNFAGSTVGSRSLPS